MDTPDHPSTTHLSFDKALYGSGVTLREEKEGRTDHTTQLTLTRVRGLGFAFFFLSHRLF